MKHDFFLLYIFFILNKNCISITVIIEFDTKHLISIAGRDGRSASHLDASQLAGQLFEHHTSSRRPRRKTSSSCFSDGHPHRCVPTLHTKHLRCHLVHPSDMGRRYGWSYPGIPHRPDVLLLRKFDRNYHPRTD